MYLCVHEKVWQPGSAEEGKAGQIVPMGTHLGVDCKSELADSRRARPGVFHPSPPHYLGCSLRLLVGNESSNRKVWNVGKRLVAEEFAGVECIMHPGHMLSAFRNTQVNCGADGLKRA